MNIWLGTASSAESSIFIQTDPFLCWGIGDQAFILSADSDCSPHWRKDEHERKPRTGSRWEFKAMWSLFVWRFFWMVVSVLGWDWRGNKDRQMSVQWMNLWILWQRRSEKWIKKEMSNVELLFSLHLKRTISICMRLSPHYGPSTLSSSSRFTFRIHTLPSAAHQLIASAGESKLAHQHPSCHPFVLQRQTQTDVNDSKSNKIVKYQQWIEHWLRPAFISYSSYSNLELLLSSSQ